ncbi:pfs domain-containing protein [Colletotrichum salicis]|uniref:Pfs domain-containing protein n=1 Tax=Colletotrichum salicis TaxID=1209931 RepID=A0A135T9W1_9PEZI|nr:pfs domain-containing protein [Colletotrichum salicis]
MEAVGAAAAILQLIDVALKTAIKVHEIYEEFRDAEDTHKRLVREMQDLTGHAQTLREMLSDEGNVASFCIEDIIEISKLLEKGPSISWPIRKRKIDRILSNIASTRPQLGLAVQTQSMATVLDIRCMLERHESYMRQHLESESNKAIFAWLNSPNVWENLQNALQRRQPGTGEWLEKMREYEHWKGNPGSSWLSGMPGAGKTIMSSTIVTSMLKEYQTTVAAVVYSYFDFFNESQQEAQSFLRTCLAQLAAKTPEAFNILVVLRNRCSEAQGQQPGFEELLEATTATSGCFHQVFLVADALDKCSERGKLLNIVKELQSLRNLHLVLLSRREHDIGRALSASTTESVVRVRDVLVALAFARRPLHVGEVMDILLSVCSSIMSISTSGGGGKKQEMMLAHASVKDYLVSEHHIRNGPASAFYTTPAQGHLLMAAKSVACLLNQNDVSRFGPHTLEEVPFLLYSALNWVHHARDANPEPDRGSLDDLIFALLHRDGDAYTNWQRSMDLVLKHGGNIDVRDWIGDTPAMFCAYNAEDPVTMEWLMDRGASLSLVSRRSGSLFQCAAMEGDPDVLEVTLRKKATNVSPDIGVDHNYNEIADLATPLQCAAYAGNLACIELF